jgi:hypothetical protein
MGMLYVPAGVVLPEPLPHPLIAATAAQRMQSKPTVHRRAIGILRRLRPPRPEGGIGSHNAMAARIPLAAPPRGSAEATEVVVVLTVSVSIAGPPDAGSVTDAGAKLQERCAGSVPQEKLTEPVSPPCGVRVMVNIPDLPRGIVRGFGLMFAVTPGFRIVSVKGAEVLPVKLALPPYIAWMVADPAALKEVARFATPFASTLLPIKDVPFKKVTAPAGTPPAPETVAVKVTVIPVSTVAEEEVSVVVVLATGGGATVKERRAVAVAGVLSESATWTEKFERPVAVGIPEIIPVAGASERPGGRVPVAMLQV